MSQTRYCSTCGTLLSQGAAICGECGARYQESPYERRATDAPGAWAQAPRSRSRDLGEERETASEDDGIQLISRESLQPKAPGATALRPPEQYDQLMVTQQPSNAPATGSASGAPAPGGSHAAGGASGAPDGAVPAMEPPLDGCVPASPLKRFLAALLDGVIATLVMIPLTIGLILVLTQETVSLLATILVGVGAALPAAYTVLMIWLHGAKGFTLGKLIMGLRTTRLSQAGPIGLLRSLGRWFLYGIASLIMALSIFLDPKKLLRGFHDRAVDSVVVDIKTGRNPMKPRPDDFERQDAEHYLGAPSVAVTTHENLLATPGSAWAGQGDASAASASSQDPRQTGGWGSGIGEASPYAPPPQDAQQTAGDSWAPPEVPALASPAPQPQQPQEQQWGVPSQPQQAPAQQWGAPSQPQQAPEQPWGGTAAQEPAAQQWQAPAAAPPGASQGPPSQHVPAEHTTDAWDDGDVDEETRAVIGADQDLGDLEQTRVSVAAPRLPAVTLRADDGTERVVTGPVVIGRNPAAGQGEVQFVLKDETRSMSKTHLRLDGTGRDIIVTDLGSTNGSAIVRADGSRESLVPNTPTVLPEGAALALGDRTLTVERDT